MQISENQMNKILGYIESGKKSGAKVECGGEREGKTGYFVQPTVFTGASEDAQISKEEIFGPVMNI